MNMNDNDFKAVYCSTVSAGCGRGKDVIIKIAANLDNAIYSVWIKPPASSEVALNFAIDGLKCQDAELFIHDKQLPSVPLKIAMKMFHAFLECSPKPVILVSQSADISTLLLKAFRNTDTLLSFADVIAGFSDVLPIWKEHFPDRTRPEQFKINVLSQKLLGKRYTTEFYETTDNLRALAELVDTFILDSEIAVHSESFDEVSTRVMEDELRNNSEISTSLLPLFATLSEDILKKMATVGITFSTLKEVFRRTDSEGLKKFLSEKRNNNLPLVTDDPTVLANIVHAVERSISDADDPFEGQQDEMMEESSSSSDEQDEIDDHEERNSYYNEVDPFNDQPDEKMYELHIPSDEEGPTDQSLDYGNLLDDVLVDQVPLSQDVVYEDPINKIPYSQESVHENPEGEIPDLQDPVDEDTDDSLPDLQAPQSSGPRFHRILTEDELRDRELMRQWHERRTSNF